MLASWPPADDSWRALQKSGFLSSIARLVLFISILSFDTYLHLLPPSFSIFSWNAPVLTASIACAILWGERDFLTGRGPSPCVEKAFERALNAL